MKISPTIAALANFSHWKAGQGGRIRANRPPEIYRACEFMAQLLAPVRDPLKLEDKELAVAVKRAICQERCKLHPGPVEKISADAFWDQISAIAERWGIKTKREDWTTTTKAEKAAA